jgi:hypothetical protein
MLIDLGMVIKNKLQKIDVDTTILKKLVGIIGLWIICDLQKTSV